MSEPSLVRFADGLTARVQPGAGTKVLWIHGYTLDSSSWREMWRRLPGWHHVGLDLPGHGGSDPIAPGDDLRKLGRKVADACLEQDIHHIVALSFGTLTATQVMLEEPDLLWSLALGAPSLAGGPSDPDVGASYWRLHQLYKHAGPGERMKAEWMSCIAWRGIEKQPALREELGRLVEAHQWTELRDWAILRLLQPPQSEDDLHRIRTPLLILIGELDLPAFHTCADILQRRVERCDRVTLTDTGHLCMLESPEASAGPIERHLRTHDRPSRLAAEPASETA